MTKRGALREAERFLENRLAVLRDYIESPDVNEILINGENDVFVEARGAMTRVDVQIDEVAIDSAIRAVMMINAKDAGNIMDARLDGMRVAAALPPVAIHGPMMAIRKHARRRFRLDEYVESGAFERLRAAEVAESRDEAPEMEAAARAGGAGLATFLRWAIRAKKNLLLSGGTSSGKTTLLSSCLLEIPAEDRIITCEDTNEIVIEQPNRVQLEAFQPAGIGIRDLIRLCLRSRPDRIIVGEIRGPEAYDFLDAMNTGHPGSLCTLHADSPEQALTRLESLMRMAPAATNLPLRDMRGQIASAIDYVVFQSRAGGRRAPQKILALDGVDDDGQYQTRVVFDRFF